MKFDRTTTTPALRNSLAAGILIFVNIGLDRLDYICKDEGFCSSPRITLSRVVLISAFTILIGVIAYGLLYVPFNMRQKKHQLLSYLITYILLTITFAAIAFAGLALIDSY